MLPIKPLCYTLFLFTLIGCQTLPEKKRMMDLSHILDSYAINYRWGNLNALETFKKHDTEIAAKESTAVTQELNDYQNIRIVNYEIIVPPTIVKETMVIQQAKVDYVYIDSQSVKSLIDRQVWQYDKEKSRWYRITELPLF